METNYIIMLNNILFFPNYILFFSVRVFRGLWTLDHGQLDTEPKKNKLKYKGKGVKFHPRLHFVYCAQVNAVSPLNSNNNSLADVSGLLVTLKYTLPTTSCFTYDLTKCLFSLGSLNMISETSAKTFVLFTETWIL